MPYSLDIEKKIGSYSLISQGDYYGKTNCGF